MHIHVFPEIRLFQKPLITNGTNMAPVSFMDPLMHLQIVQIIECLCAYTTHIRFDPRVHQQVLPQLGLSDEPLSTLVALVRFLPGMPHHVIINIRNIVATNGTKDLSSFQLVYVPVVIVKGAGVLENLVAGLTRKPGVNGLFYRNTNMAFELTAVLECLQAMMTLAHFVLDGVTDVFCVDQSVTVEVFRIREALQAHFALVWEFKVGVVRQNVTVVVSFYHETFAAVFTFKRKLFEVLNPMRVQVVQLFKNSIALVALVVSLILVGLQVQSEIRGCVFCSASYTFVQPVFLVVLRFSLWEFSRFDVESGERAYFFTVWNA